MIPQIKPEDFGITQAEADGHRRRHLTSMIATLTKDIDALIVRAKEHRANGLQDWALEIFIENRIEPLIKDRQKHQSQLDWLNDDGSSLFGQIDPYVIKRCKSVPVHSLGLPGLQSITPSGGGRYRAICPFHNDTHPSLVLYPEDRGYHCFVCSQGGDNIDLVMRLLDTSFPGAIRYLMNYI